ncbi:uncharacterized protein YaeQ [Halospina denitrificans]|uniref:Uncharacterized protein YaeQ n=1 Tax=Halospina denitrificans TaxID=332522 RepID=A0A4R7JTS0_9GAMM|nr:YaeQ family protein [Halospina denitrificans]TDT41700.1 uncharacterized protein YaeQ [Halospina denitrificans]
MALKATICKAALTIADMDRQYYGDHSLTLAQHPSENDERLMVRLLAFALNASETLEFTRGLSTDDEPELWDRNLTGEIDLWIELGLPDEDRIRKACNRARRVRVYAYGGRIVDVWWQKLHGKLGRYDNLEVINLPRDGTQALADMADKGMALQCTIQEGQVGVGNEHSHVMLEPEWLLSLTS